MEQLHADSFRWLHNTYLKPVTEYLLIPAQDQALNTNLLSCHIHRSDLCRQCKRYPETIEHIIAGCLTTAQNHHSVVTSAIHWSHCDFGWFSCSIHWWQHEPQSVLDNINYKLLYDFTDRRISAWRPVWISTQTSKDFLMWLVSWIDMSLISTGSKPKGF